MSRFKQNALAQGSMVFWALCLAGATAPAADERAQPMPHETIAVDEGRVLLETGANGEMTEVQDVEAYCLECHGGTQGATAQVPHQEGAYSHPSNIPYPTASDDYVAQSSLGREIPLIGGKVTCISCHSASSPNRELILPLADSRLCAACHKV